MKSNWERDWNKFLKSANTEMRAAIAEQLNKEANLLVSKIRESMAAVGIHERSGALVGSLKVLQATPENPRTAIISEVYAPRPKRPNRNRHLWRKKGWSMNGLNLSKDIRYPRGGVPYGRILEFSPRLNKPFFYKSFYNSRKEIKERIFNTVRNVWQKVG